MKKYFWHNFEEHCSLQDNEPCDKLATLTKTSVIEETSSDDADSFFILRKMGTLLTEAGKENSDRDVYSEGYHVIPIYETNG